MMTEWTDYNKAHTQPFDVNAEAPRVEDWGLYNAAHADPGAIPIHSIQASPGGCVSATAKAHADAPEMETGSATASVSWQETDTPAMDASTLAQYEAIAPGLALALLQAEQAQAKQRRLYRLTRLGVTSLIAVTAIACGQWALVHGADQQALYLSGAGLISLLTTVLQHE